ncbi:pantetheine-phosphate adenylyltransferase [Fusobacterium sp.]|uniref:pantetheine-phosphate adenylyltransferase n=1 Tax=Fusobacterium sp. TaxID=68766 RepID=UPI002611F2A4|nr:pantetheine-phosphate adenylyltransferase [Fusobacterium sp.]
MKVGVYSGSFDPITLGHQDVIKRAAKMFDKIVVVVGNNSEKKYWFSLEERTEMVKELLGEYENIEIDSYSGLIVNYVLENNYDVIVKGVRNQEDCALELYFADGNYMISDKKVDTVFLPALKEYIHTSSTAAREIARYGGKVECYVDKRIATRVLERGKKFAPK